MNKTYRLVWNDIRNTWVVTDENARSRGKPASTAKSLAIAGLLGTLLAQTPGAHAIDANTLPSGAHVVSGQADIGQSGSQMTIRQGSDKAIINWNDFSIGSKGSVNFIQNSSSSVALNRVVGSGASIIDGGLTANGQVFLINPNGVLFGKGAQVDVGGLVASTLGISNQNFLAGKYQFTDGNGAGTVINQGELIGKFVALLAPEVRNEGVIAARRGTVVLAAGDAVALNISGNSLIDVQVDAASVKTLVENKRMIEADAGMVIMSAQSASSLLGNVINTGTVEANGIEADGGTIRLLASSTINHGGSISANAGQDGKGGDVILLASLANANSATTVSGVISARGGSQSGNGGFIETSGSHLKIASSATIDTSALYGNTGRWLLDPMDFTIAAVNGDMTGATLSAALASSNVTIMTTDGSVSCTGSSCGSGTPSGGSGSIFVNDSVSWGSNRALTLNAWGDIVINAPISVTGTGALNLQFGQSDVESNFPSGAYTVNAKVNLASGSSFTTKYGSDGATINYEVITSNAGLANINSNMAGRYVLGSDVTATTNPWVPLGNAGLDADTATAFTGILDGLGHTIDGLTRANTDNGTGIGLFGVIGGLGTVSNLGLTNVNIAGRASVGALAGRNSGWVQNVYATGVVTGSDAAGVGPNTGTNDDSVGSIGGLIGRNSGTVMNVYTDVAVTATTGIQATGGLTDGGTGGLIGANDSAVTNAYSKGNVNGELNVGGLIGWNNGPVTSAYTSGTVTGTTHVGNVIGVVESMNPMPWLFHTYWISDNAGTSSFSDAYNSSTRLTVAQSTLQSYWAGFDFNNSWVIDDTVSTPLLRSMLTPSFATAANPGTTGGGATSGGTTVAGTTPTDQQQQTLDTTLTIVQQGFPQSSTTANTPPGGGQLPGQPSTPPVVPPSLPTVTEIDILLGDGTTNTTQTTNSGPPGAGDPPKPPAAVPVSAPQAPAQPQGVPALEGPLLTGPNLSGLSQDGSGVVADALVVNTPISNAVFSAGSRVSVTVPADSFAHTGDDATVTLAATMANGAPLPGWLRFNPKSGTFEGTPPPGFKGEIAIRVNARDSEGRAAVQTFKISIK